MATCSNCSVEYTPRHDAAGKFCSIKCVNARGSKRPVNNCVTCGNETKNNKFCSKSCSAQTTNSTNPRRKKITRTCAHCGTETSNEKFCSFPCSIEYMYQKNVVDWLSGARPQKSTSNFIRRYLYETRGEKCEHCGWCEVHTITGRTPLQIDHIDGNDRNNVIENLRVLCPNCHSLTPTYCFIGARRIPYER